MEQESNTKNCTLSKGATEFGTFFPFHNSNTTECIIPLDSLQGQQMLKQVITTALEKQGNDTSGIVCITIGDKLPTNDDFESWKHIISKVDICLKQLEQSEGALNYGTGK